MFFEFLVYIGIVNLVIGFIWPFPAYIIELLLGKLNHVLSHAIHRLLGTILLSMITVNLANYYSDSLLVFIIYCIIGLLLNLSALLQAIGAIEKSSYNFSFDLMQRSKSNDRANFDYKYSVLFYPASFLIFIIFPFLTENVITENSFYFIDFVINIPFIGWIIPIIGGIVGVIFIPYALFMLWTTYILSNITDIANKEDGFKEVKTEIKEEDNETEQKLNEIFKYKEEDNETEPEHNNQVICEIEPITYTDDELDEFEKLSVRIDEALPMGLYIIADVDYVKQFEDYNNNLTEYFKLLEDELKSDYLDYLSFFYYEDYMEFKTKKELDKYRIDEIKGFRGPEIESELFSFLEELDNRNIRMFHDDWYHKNSSNEFPPEDKEPIRLMADKIIKRFKSKISEYNGKFSTTIRFGKESPFYLK